MNDLFVGSIFVFLNINVHLGNVQLGLLPDFVGYFLIARGLATAAEDSRYFMKAKPWAQGMAFCSLCLYILDLLAGSAQMQMLAWVLSLAALAVKFLIGYWIIAGFLQIEQARGWDLQAEKLRSMWVFSAVLNGICTICGWIPFVGAVGVLASCIIGICYLAALYKTKNLYLSAKGA